VFPTGFVDVNRSIVGRTSCRKKKRREFPEVAHQEERAVKGRMTGSDTRILIFSSSGSGAPQSRSEKKKEKDGYRCAGPEICDSHKGRCLPPTEKERKGGKPTEIRNRC